MYAEIIWDSFLKREESGFSPLMAMRTNDLIPEECRALGIPAIDIILAMERYTLKDFKDALVAYITSH